MEKIDWLAKSLEILTEEVVKNIENDLKIEICIDDAKLVLSKNSLNAIAKSFEEIYAMGLEAAAQSVERNIVELASNLIDNIDQRAISMPKENKDLGYTIGWLTAAVSDIRNFLPN